MVYSDYVFYEDKYHGKLLTEEEFKRWIMIACAHVRRITFGRADSCADKDEIKMATCAVCDVLFQDNKQTAAHDGRMVASENTDGYSVSYVQEQGSTAQVLLIRKVYAAAEVFLAPTGLLSFCLEDDIC